MTDTRLPSAYQANNALYTLNDKEPRASVLQASELTRKHHVEAMGLGEYCDASPRLSWQSNMHAHTVQQHLCCTVCNELKYVLVKCPS